MHATHSPTHASFCSMFRVITNLVFPDVCLPTRRIPVDWSEYQKQKFVEIAETLIEEKAASYCTVAICLKTTHYIHTQEEKHHTQSTGKPPSRWGGPDSLLL